MQYVHMSPFRGCLRSCLILLGLKTPGLSSAVARRLPPKRRFDDRAAIYCDSLPTKCYYRFVIHSDWYGVTSRTLLRSSNRLPEIASYQVSVEIRLRSDNRSS